MRVQMICASALLSVGCTWGAGIAHAQGYPQGYAPGYGYPQGYAPSNGYPQGYPQGYPPTNGYPQGYPPGYGYPQGYAPGYAAPPMPGYAPNPAAYGYNPAMGYPGPQAYQPSAMPPLPPVTGPGAPTAAPTVQPTAMPSRRKPSSPAPADAPPVDERELPSEPVVKFVGKAPPPPPARPSPPALEGLGCWNGLAYLTDGPGCGASSTAEPAPGLAHVPRRASQDHVWVNAEYLMAFIRPQRLPTPLVTTGSVTDTHPGALGQPGTSVLFGNNIDYGMQNGIRLNAGFFVDNSSRFSLEGDGLYLFQKSVDFNAASDPAGNPLLARPIFDTASKMPRSEIYSAPGFATGSVAVNSQSRLFGYEVNGRYYFSICKGLSGDALFGFRYLNLQESIDFNDGLRPFNTGALTFNGTNVAAGDLLTDFDSFSSRNTFYGLQLGARLRYDTDWFFVRAYGKIALGENNQHVNINGGTSLFDPAGNQSTAGGVLAQTSNIGDYRHTAFSVVPETGVNVGINITPNLQVMAGYSFLYWSQVARPGDQIDPRVNSTTVPANPNFGQPGGVPAPTFHFNSDYFRLQTFNLGVNFHF